MLNTHKAALAAAAIIGFAISGGSAMADTTPVAAVGMTAASYISESPGANGQTNLLDSAGQVIPLSPSVALTLNSDRQAEGLTAIPIVTATEATSERAQIESPFRPGAFRADTFASQTGNCGTASVDLEKSNSVQASWYTAWDVVESVTGPINSFAWKVSGNKINTKTWNEAWDSDSWNSDVFYPANGSGDYTATIASDGVSVAVGSKSACYAGEGITATATV